MLPAKSTGAIRPFRTLGLRKYLRAGTTMQLTVSVMAPQGQEHTNTCKNYNHTPIRKPNCIPEEALKRTKHLWHPRLPWLPRSPWIPRSVLLKGSCIQTAGHARLADSVKRQLRGGVVEAAAPSAARAASGGCDGSGGGGCSCGGEECKRCGQRGSPLKATKGPLGFDCLYKTRSP